jgi:hypothetical protein
MKKNPFKNSVIKNLVFHGTRRGGFQVFDLSAPSQTNAPDSGLAIWFASQRRDAEIYTRHADKYKDRPQVYSVFLNIKKPFKTDKLLNDKDVKKIKADGYDAILIEFNEKNFHVGVFSANQIDIVMVHDCFNKIKEREIE